MRYLVVSHFVDGKNRTEIAQYLKVSRVSVNKWVKAYLDNGLEGLKEKLYSGRLHRLTEEQKSDLKKYVIKNVVNDSGNRLKTRDIGLYIESNFDTSYKKSALYQLLHDIGFVQTKAE